MNSNIKTLHANASSELLARAQHSSSLQVNQKLVQNELSKQEMLFRKKTTRSLCASRLDYASANSLINQTEFRGLFNLWSNDEDMQNAHWCMNCDSSDNGLLLYLVWDPFLRYSETGVLVDVMLAKLMFSNVAFLLSLWMFFFILPLIHYLAYILFYKNTISRCTVRVIQYSVQSILLVGSVISCISQKWTILPCSFVTVVALIYTMKMHSFIETQLELYDDWKRCVGSLEPRKLKLKDSHEQLLLENPNGSLVFPTPHGFTTKQNQTAVLSVLSPFFQKISAFFPKQTSAFFVKNHCLPNVFCATCETQGVEGPTLKYFFYYLCCPVLVYETCYPCSSSFRWHYIFQKFLAMFASLNALYIVSVRFLIPIMRMTSLDSFFLGLARLMWPLFFCYFLMFYFLFECLCNLLSELTYFGHRDFYHDWWNSTSFDEFSRKWNRPVYEFLSRHVYHKIRLYFKVSKLRAITATFFVSAVFHELIMIICFKHVGFCLFGLMMLQIPLTITGKWHKSKDVGNSLFWIQIIIGLPLVAFLYGRKYTLKVKVYYRFHMKNTNASLYHEILDSSLLEIFMLVNVYAKRNVDE